jgi:AraC-like DNA-binding protein
MADTPFHHSVKPIFGKPRVVRTTLSPGFLFRDDDLVRDGDSGVSLVIAQSKLDTMHRGREVQLHPGEATVMQADAPGRCGSCKGFVVSELMIPPAEWEIRGGQPGDALMQRIGRDSDAPELLRGYIRSLERIALATSVEACEIVRRHLIDLIVLAASLHPSIGESSASAVLTARLHAALDHITSQFENPELSLAMVTQRLRISSRYLQRLLEISGTSFTERVNELRLQRAYTLLTEAREGKSRIADVALQVGFSDTSHFNRVFRSRFGATPSDVRAEGKKMSMQAQEATTVSLSD